MPVGLRPPWVKISQRRRLARRETFLASIATTMHWSPNFSAASLTKARSLDRRRVDRNLVGAGEQQLADILDRAHAAADRQRHEAGFGGAATTSKMVSRFSWLAVMSRKQSSSAPAAS